MTAKRRDFTFAEYLALEAVAIERHEFHQGKILAMRRESIEHSRIVRNMIVALGNALRGKPCENFESNLRVGIPSAGSAMYADGTIICGPPEFHPEDPVRGTVINPRVVIEVLSPTSESYDRGDKFALYRNLGSLQEYILISEVRPRVETFIQQADARWQYRSYSGLDAKIVLPTVEVGLSATDIYEDVEFASALPIPDHES